MKPARVLIAVLLVALIAAAGVRVAAAQAASQAGVERLSLMGIVLDPSGGLVQGADVVLVHLETGTVHATSTEADGTFHCPRLPAGHYRVTVTHAGFSTIVLDEVALSDAVQPHLRVVLEVGSIQETVVVRGQASTVQTIPASVAATLNVRDLARLPLNDRDVLALIALLPGIDATADGPHAQPVGLPPEAASVTMDGISLRDNYVRTADGFFLRLIPRLDAIGEATFLRSAQEADSSAQEAAEIRLTTRAGTNQFRGSGYYYLRHDWLNTNTWFNRRDHLPKPALVQHQPGARVGGPIVIPKVWDGRNKGFFFVNYEEFYQPSTITSTRTVLRPEAQEGWFLYNTASGVERVNLLELAAAHGQLASVDPIVGALLADIRAATARTGTLTELVNPSIERYVFQQPGTNHNQYPTVRIDFNLTKAHRLTASVNAQRTAATPDAGGGRQRAFPGFPVVGIQRSTRYNWQASLRSTFGKRVVNEFRFGMSGGISDSNGNMTAAMWSGTSVANQAGYQLNLGAMGISHAGVGSTSTSLRESPGRVIENTLSWTRGSHHLSFGGSLTRSSFWTRNQTLVPSISFGVVTGDPAESLFSADTIPGASSSDLSNARALYALLVGRVSSISRNARIDAATDRYVVLGPSRVEGRMYDVALYAQDGWRVRPDLTVTAGLRYDLQLPFRPLNNSYSTATIADLFGVTGVGPDFKPGSVVTGLGYLFQPGVLEGQPPTYKPFEQDTRAFNIDWNNLSPSVSVAWMPSPTHRLLRRLLGSSGDTVIRGGFSRGYHRNSISDYTEVFGANPGMQIDASRSLALGNLGELPLLLRESDRLGPPAIQETRVYPMPPPTTTGSVNLFDPNITAQSSENWSIGVQRALSKTIAIELRYADSRTSGGWAEYNYNEYNIIENGFLDEFKRAQANLQANIAAGRGSTFKYYGPGTDTSPLPIFLAYFEGVPLPEAGDPSKYTSSSFSSTTFLGPLAAYNPSPYGMADLLDGSASRRANALAAGLPPNFLVVNPDMLGGAKLTANGGASRHRNVQIELRRRMSGGLQFQISYAWQTGDWLRHFSFRRPRVRMHQTGGDSSIAHTLRLNWIYELPIGQGQRFLSGAGSRLDRLVGGWSFQGTGRVQSGRLVDFGNVRLVGFTKKDLARMFRIRLDEDRKVWMLPQDVIDNTVKAFSVSATDPSGYGPLGPPSGRYFAPANGPDCLETVPGWGDCGLRSVIVAGPPLIRFDMSLAKQIPLSGRVNVELRAEVFNVFNRTNFPPITGLGSNPDSFEVGWAIDQSRTSQLVLRINW